MNNKFVRASVLTLSLALAACGGGDSGSPSSATPPSSSASPPPSMTSPDASLLAGKDCDLPDFQQEVLKRVNEARANSRMCGTTFYAAAGSLTWNGKLFDAAAGHAADMANNNYFSHDSLDGRAFDQRITAAGYEWSAVGENIAAGQATVEQAMNDWLQSPGHCVNIMNGAYTEIGVSCVKNASSTYKQYWAMELGLPL